MSHNIRYATYNDKINKNAVQREWDAFVRCADRGEGASGLSQKIRWNDNVSPLENEERASRWIDEHDRGWYDQLAVRFYDIKGNDKLDEIRNRRSEIMDKLSERENILVKDARTSAFIGCVKCGSKLSRVHLTSNKCPVCHEDLRSTTELNAIDALKKKAKTLQERIKAEEARLRKKAKIKWLVKIEYHT